MNSAYYNKYEKHHQELNFEKRQAVAMKKNADRNKLIGQELLKRAEECSNAGDIEKSEILYTGAGHEFVKCCEKLQKSLLVASNHEDAVFPKRKKIIESHNNRVIRQGLKQYTNIELMSYQDALMVDNIHKGQDLSYIRLQYSEDTLPTLGRQDCYALYTIVEKVYTNYDKSVNEDRQRKQRHMLEDRVTALIRNNYIKPIYKCN